MTNLFIGHPVQYVLAENGQNRMTETQLLTSSGFRVRFLGWTLGILTDGFADVLIRCGQMLV